MTQSFKVDAAKHKKTMKKWNKSVLQERELETTGSTSPAPKMTSSKEFSPI